MTSFPVEPLARAVLKQVFTSAVSDLVANNPEAENWTWGDDLTGRTVHLFSTLDWPGSVRSDRSGRAGYARAGGRGDRTRTRRAFLKASLAGLLALIGRVVFPAEAQAARFPEGRLSLLHLHTGERATIVYRTPEGLYDPDALHELNRLLRCHYTDEVKPIDIRVIEFVNAVDKRLGGRNEIQIVSGYRSPLYNELLRRQGRRVAKDSFHVHGRAIDLRIPRVGLDHVRRVALGLAWGGVGYYPRAGFLHLDSGPYRWW